jgi:hypothetical protein
MGSTSEERIMTKEEIVQVLETAVKCIDGPKQWTRGVFAANYLGDEVEPDSGAATCWCAEGAIVKALAVHGHDSDTGSYDFDEVTDELRARFPPSVVERGLSVASYNDKQRERRPVVRLFKKAIAELSPRSPKSPRKRRKRS